MIKNHHGFFEGIMNNPETIEHLIVEGRDFVENIMTTPSLYESFISRITSYTKDEMEDVILFIIK